MEKIMNCLELKWHNFMVRMLNLLHCNSLRIPIGGGRCIWLITLRGYALKINPTIDDIWRQPNEEFETIKEALDVGFEYIYFV
jgi:hypothetical protein